MSIRLQSLVWKYSRHKGTPLTVLLAIADHISDDDLTGWPGYKRLAQMARVDERTAMRAVAVLLESGELELMERGGGRFSNKYRINEDVLTANPVVIGDTGDTDDTPVENVTPVIGVTPGVSQVSGQGWRGRQGNHNRTTIEPSLDAADNPPAPPTTDPPGISERRPSRKKDTPAPDPNLTPAQRFFLDAFSARRFKTTVQKETVTALEERFGLERLQGAVRWAAKKGLSLGDAVVAVERALEKHNGGPSANGANKRTKIDPIQQARR